MLIGGGEYSFDDLLLDAIEKVLDLESDKKEKYFDNNVNKLWSYFLSSIEKEKTTYGIHPSFIVINATTRKITSYAHHMYNISGHLQYDLLKSKPYILNEIDLLSHREYEALSVLVCKLLSAKHYYLTPPGNEGGIDFIATLKFANLAHCIFGVNGPIRIIGQCKKYTSLVKESQIKEFNSTLADVYHLTSKMRKVLPSWFYESRAPIIGWVIGESGFQTGAIQRAKDFGILLSDTTDLGEVISTSTRFHESEPFDQRHKGLKSDIKAILEEFDY